MTCMMPASALRKTTRQSRRLSCVAAHRRLKWDRNKPEENAVAVDSLELHLASAQQRLATLQRRASADVAESKLLPRALKEAENLLEELRVAQEQLVEARQRLEDVQTELTRQYEKYWDLFDQMSDAYVVTKSDSSILEANCAAAELFNVSQRFLIGKPLSVFVCEDRSGFLKILESTTEHAGPTELSFRFRPRERAPLDVSATIRNDGSSIRWVLRPAGIRASVEEVPSSGV
jgi:two-component system, OmpR family, sensor histidine kinase VicK